MAARALHTLMATAQGRAASTFSWPLVRQPVPHTMLRAKYEPHHGLGISAKVQEGLAGSRCEGLLPHVPGSSRVWL